MSIEYTWLAESLQAAPEEDGLELVVKTVNWRVNAYDTESPHTATAYGTVAVEGPDPNSFIPYADLTEEVIISAVKTALTNPEGGSGYEQIEANLAGEINKKKNPPIIAPPLPW